MAALLSVLRKPVVPRAVNQKRLGLAAKPDAATADVEARNNRREMDWLMFLFQRGYWDLLRSY